MKILTSEEIKAHRNHTLLGGLEGCVAGLAISAIGFKFLPKRYPNFKPKTLPWSMKTAMFITPPTLLTAICAEEASNSFEEMRYSSDLLAEESKERLANWQNSTISEKLIDGLSLHKYKIIVGLWAGSLYGSWVYVNRDKIMTTSQKAVQARMYAQFITVLLLLASIGLSTYENSLHPDKKKLAEDLRWKHALQAAEQQEIEEKTRKNIKFDNKQRVDGKIFK